MLDLLLQRLAAQQEPGGGRRRDQDHRADARGDVQPVDERVLCRRDQCVRLLRREAVGRFDGAAQGLVGRRCGTGRDAVRGDEVLVDAGDDGAEQGDAEGGAEFVRRLGDADAEPACSFGTLERITSEVTVKAKPAPMPTTSSSRPISG